jgi:hypothetical protein
VGQESNVGIDIYLRYRGMTDEEQQKQYGGFRIDAGDVGYLREAYHGGPYATRMLVPQAFTDGNDAALHAMCTADDKAGRCKEWEGEMCGYVAIPAAAMRERLEETLATVRLRSLKVYGEPADDATLKAFTDFVELAERWQKEGKSIGVHASY